VSTLWIGRSESTCGVCLKNALPQDKTHDWTYGYDPQAGCGTTWTHVATSYAGSAMEAAARALRPDLIFVPSEVSGG